MQEMIVQAKNDEFGELAASKKTKVAVLNSKKAELEEEKKRNEHKVRVEEKDVKSKDKRFQHKIVELEAMETQVKQLEEGLPRPLDDDYNCLVEQNNKINKELLRF